MVEPPVMLPTMLWVVPGPERTFRLAVVVALRLSCGVGFQVTVTPERLPWVWTKLAYTHPATASLNWICHKVAVAASLPRML